MKYIILDLEATCWNDRTINKQNETIEIGAVKIENGEKTSEFCKFIKPKLNPILSDFCKELTTIKQSDVDNANDFITVISEFKKWIGDDYLLCSWGYYDKFQFMKDCKLHNLDTDWLNNHISLKHQYKNIKQLKKPIGMKGALKIEGIKLDGTHHRGIDDAKNISKIFINNFNEWIY